VILFKIKESLGLVSFEYLKNIETSIFLGFFLISIRAFSSKSSRHTQEINQIDRVLAILPYGVLYLVSDFLSFQNLTVISFSMYLLFELLKVERIAKIDKLLKNFFYSSPLNPLTFYLLFRVSNSQADLWQKAFLVFLFCQNWTCLYLDGNTQKSKTSRNYTCYLVILVFLAGIYVYENI
jgi:hypothetical protein